MKTSVVTHSIRCPWILKACETALRAFLFEKFSSSGGEASLCCSEENETVKEMHGQEEWASTTSRS